VSLLKGAINDRGCAIGASAGVDGARDGAKSSVGDSGMPRRKGASSLPHNRAFAILLRLHPSCCVVFHLLTRGALGDYPRDRLSPSGLRFSRPSRPDRLKPLQALPAPILQQVEHRGLIYHATLLCNEASLYCAWDHFTEFLSNTASIDRAQLSVGVSQVMTAQTAPHAYR
jgi:hypothetical protein